MAESSLLPVLSALGGVALAQCVAMFQSWLDRKNKREILLRTKYEELGSHFLDSFKLPQALLMCASDEEALTVTHQTDGNKVHMLALVYFPLLRQATGKYVESYSELCKTAISLYNSKDKGVLGAQIFNKPEYIKASGAHIAARDYLRDQIETYSATYAKS